jgi:hypothetical protein
VRGQLLLVAIALGGLVANERLSGSVRADSHASHFVMPAQTVLRIAADNGITAGHLAELTFEALAEAHHVTLPTVPAISVARAAPPGRP